MSAPTPTPWIASGSRIVADEFDGVLAFCLGAESGPTNAAHIARVVNAHDELVAALRGYVERDEEHKATLHRPLRDLTDKWLEEARSALAKGAS